MHLEDDHYCFVCGSLNEAGLKLEFKLDKENRSISTQFTPQKIHQGFKDLVHGGLIGMVMDECTVNLAWKLGIHSVSAEYTVRLIKPAFIEKKLEFSARIISEKTKLLTIEAFCKDEEDRDIASASSKCIKIR